eukprot:SM000050S17029  [mRNA]  locus=s50:499289:500922:+ [translate_table: standard]
MISWTYVLATRLDNIAGYSIKTRLQAALEAFLSSSQAAVFPGQRSSEKPPPPPPPPPAGHGGGGAGPGRAEGDAVPAAAFALAAAQIAVLFRHLGVVFGFAERDYVSKVKDLEGAARRFATLDAVVEADHAGGTVRKALSHTRNLLRVKRGLDFVALLFASLIASSEMTLKQAAQDAYVRIFAPHHSWSIRKAVGLGMHTLPTKTQFLRKLREDETSWKREAAKFLEAATPLLQDIVQLYESRNLGTDW